MAQHEGSPSQLLPRDRLLASMGWVITRFGTLQNHGNKDGAPEGAIWDSFAHKQDLELCVRTRKMLMLQQSPWPCLPVEGDGSAWSHTALQDVLINAK